MLEHEEGTRLGEDPEELHDMRVSTRRMRMALRVFGDYLDPDVMRPVLKGLRRTGRTLGAVRDLDVFNEKTQVYLDGLPDERAGDLDGLLEAWKAERDKQREHLIELPRRAPLPPLRRDDHASCSTDPPRRWRRRTSSRRGRSASPRCCPASSTRTWPWSGPSRASSAGSRRRCRASTRCARRARGCGTRSSSSRTSSVPGARPLIKRVKGLQDHLGDLQDAVVTSGILRDYLTWGTWRHEGHDLPGPLEVIVAPGAARYLRARQEEMERLVLSFPEVWPTVAGNEFSRELAAVIAEIRAGLTRSPDRAGPQRRRRSGTAITPSGRPNAFSRLSRRRSTAHSSRLQSPRGWSSSSRLSGLAPEARVRDRSGVAAVEVLGQAQERAEPPHDLPRAPVQPGERLEAGRGEGLAVEVARWPP